MSTAGTRTSSAASPRTGRSTWCRIGNRPGVPIRRTTYFAEVTLPLRNGRDVSDARAVEALAEAAIDRFGKVNILCNNAGVGHTLTESPHEVFVDEWRWVIEVNLMGVIHGHAAFLPHLLSHGDGHIVNIASASGFSGEHGAYAAGRVRTRFTESVRNRPDWAATPSTELSPELAGRIEWGRRSERLGLDPEIVAERVLAAIEANQLWAVIDPGIITKLEERLAVIRDPRNLAPSPTLSQRTWSRLAYKAERMRGRLPS